MCLVCRRDAWYLSGEGEPRIPPVLRQEEGECLPTPKVTDRERQSRSGPRMPVPWWNVEVSIYDQGAGGRTSQEREGDSP